MEPSQTIQASNTAALSGSDLAAACRALGLELYEVLQGLDPVRWRAEKAARVTERLKTLRGHAQAIRARFERADAADTDLLGWCEELAALDLPAADATDAPGAPDDGNAGVDWAGLRQRLTHSYDALHVRLRARGTRVPRNRPTNYLRNAYHMANGLMIVLLIELVLTPQTMIDVAAAFCVAAWTTEIVRRRSRRLNGVVMRAFRDVAHPDEHHTINSATWMVTALLLIALAFDPQSCAIAVAVLGFADPAAALIGRRFGKTKLRGSKTLEGTLAFALTGAVVALVIMAIWGQGLTVAGALVIAVSAALPAAIIELYSSARHLDDNFSIPVVAATGAWLAQQLLS